MRSREKKLESTIKTEEKKAGELGRNIEISNQDIEKYEKELATLEKNLKKEEADLESVSIPCFAFCLCLCLRWLR